MPQGLVDTISPYMDYNAYIDGVDYRKAIFVFLSKDGTQKLNRKTLDYKGQDRMSLKLKDLEDLIKTNANSKGFSKSSLFSCHLITAHIPFLPLEKRHVKECIRDQLKVKKYYDITDEIVENITKELYFYPDDNPIFCTTGYDESIEGEDNGNVSDIVVPLVSEEEEDIDDEILQVQEDVNDDTDTDEIIWSEANQTRKQQLVGRNDTNWTETDFAEMSAYLGILILMGIIQVPEYKFLWSTNEFLNNGGVKDVMPVKRYEKLTQYLHVNEPEADSSDKLARIRPILDSVLERCRVANTPRKNQSIDEAMIP
ncbi:TOR1 [Mytilus coruscus]|uniref:TOR1 n=1 Tax=Mytilus coruscus TaxID=42192 RepID=A0A6J8EX16_MYTCO|nr:TOR1 [Mytilus coruscus]